MAKQQDTNPPPGPVTWVGEVCTGPDGTSATIAWVRVPVASPKPRPAAATLAQQALSYIPLPLPAVGMNPPPNEAQLVNLPVWLWVSPATWKPVSTSASAGGVTVIVTAVPESVTWSMGDGGAVTCGPGTPYNSQDPAQAPSCSYIYHLPSAPQPGGAYSVAATVTWHATWSASGAAGGGDLGNVERTSTTRVVVTEAQALNTAPSA